ncbi:HupE/UreJ family protein [Undibacterium sp.]|uniref:HupE/UreJ family protein n=1 Tax=Undibacterium sp. TaxID=1914977 RepID=UPI0025CCE239|nr:HupE/UreJ family protein [Undibacterium sp.]
MHICIPKNNISRAITAGLLLIPSLALAHGDVSHLPAGVQGFSSGFLHPLTGFDHLLAMLAVGIWAAQNRRTGMWLLPVMFPLMMLVGAAIGLQAYALPGIETGIALSVAALGLLIGFAVSLPAFASAALIAVFAMLHGYAHGAELPAAASGLIYCLGFLASTATLHLIGLVLGLSFRRFLGETASKLTGAMIASCGLLFLYNLA